MNSPPKKIYYISPRDMLKGRVDPIMMMQTCHSLVKENAEVVLVTPYYRREDNTTRKNLWQYYNLPEGRFKVVMLKTFLRDESSEIRVWISKFILNLLYSLRIFVDVLMNPPGRIQIISRCMISTYPYLLILWPLRKWKKINFIFELHFYKNSFNYNYVIKRMDGLVTISQALKDYVVKYTGFDAGNIVVGRMGVNLEHYKPHLSISELRKNLKIKDNGCLAVYTGKVPKSSPELIYILKAAKKAPDISFMVVGGRLEIVEHWKKLCRLHNIENVKFTGFVKPSEVMKYQLAADVLLMYYDSSIPTRDFTSPGKMMEYMATGRPIVSSDFPVFREVLHHQKNAILVPPDNPDLLAKAVKKLSADREFARRLGEQAQKDVVQYTWDNRAKLMMTLINRLSNHTKTKKLKSPDMARKKKRIYYISPRDMLKSRVDPIMMMQTCSSIAKEGYEVILVTPTVFRRENIPREKIWQHYKLPENQFKIVMLPTVLKDTSSLNFVRISKFLVHFFYTIRIFLDALFRPKGEVVILSRCLVSTIPHLIALSILRKWKDLKFMFELHALSAQKADRYVLEKMDFIFCISEGLRSKLCKQFTITRQQTSIARMGVNLSYYTNHRDLNAFREQNGLGKNRFIAMYTGKIYPDQKEVELILSTAPYCPDALFVMVGGTSEAVAHWQGFCSRNNINNVKFTGFVSPADVVNYQMCSDALLIYYPNNWPIKDFVSPGKMMEYMATGNSIIAVDFPVIKEVLVDGKNALLVPPDRPDLLAKTIARLAENPLLVKKLGRQAKKDVVRYSWDSRARLMLVNTNKL